MNYEVAQDVPLATSSDMISNINKSGISIILVEQNARMALGLASTIYILEVGSIVLEGAAQEVANDERVKKAYLGG